MTHEYIASAGNAQVRRWKGVPQPNWQWRDLQAALDATTSKRRMEVFFIRDRRDGRPVPICPGLIVGLPYLYPRQGTVCPPFHVPFERDYFKCAVGLDRTRLGNDLIGIAPTGSKHSVRSSD